MTTTARFTIPVVSFRQLETPFQKRGYRDYFAVVEIKHLPDLTNWRKINVRDPKLTGYVPQRISDCVVGEPEMFLFMNRGLTLSVESVSFDNKTSNLTLTMRDPNLHGLLDGGHTYKILLEHRDDLEEPQYVKLEILQGFDKGNIEDLVDARNTSKQVQDESLMNLEGKFVKLKEAIKGRRYANLIAYKEYELDADGSPKPIDVREVIAILTAFDRETYNHQVHPIDAYRSKAACLKHFKDHDGSYDKIYPIVNDVLELYDYIQLHLPEHYNKAGGKFGKLTGVTTYKGKHKRPLYFIGKESEYSVPSGFVYPMLGAFRALLKEKNGRYVWGKNLVPLQLLQEELGKALVDTIGSFARDARNPSKTGKQQLVWQACYQTAQVVYLQTETES